MSKCPHCGGDLVQDAQNTNKLLCFNCHKRYDIDKINQYWAERGGATQPVQPAQPVQPYQPEQPQTQPVQAYQPQAAPYGAAPQSAPYSPQQPGVSQQQPYPQVPDYMQPQLPKGMAIASLVMGIISFLSCLIPVVSTILGIVAVILGIVAMGKASRGVAGGKGIAIGGLITGILGTILSILFLIFVVGVVNYTMDEMDNANINFANEEQVNEFANSLANSIIENSNYDFNYNSSVANSNATANTNSNGNANSSASNANANANTTTMPAANAGSAGGSWQQGEFSFNGQKFVMGKTTLQEFADATGWTIDLAAEGYEDGYIVEKQQRMSTISLDNPAYEDSNIYVSVSVANAGDERLDLMECPLFSINISTWNLDKPYPECSINGVGLGADIADAVALGGEKSDGDGYSTVEIDADGNYVTFQGDPDKISGITFNTYNY